jgi:membrane associated rhomboid family serine protease
MIPVFGVWLIYIGALKPSLVFPGGQIWRLGTYIFLHGGVLHVLFNMIGLWMFGVELENMWGTRRFVYFYFITGIGSGILSLFMVFLGDNPIIGASGAIYAILATYAFYYPNRQVLLFFIIPVPVWLIVLLMIFISLAGFLQMAGGISHITHLGGIIIAYLNLRYYDKIVAWNIHRNALKAEKTMRINAEKKIQKDRYFEEVIDPILKKISEHGMDSLTKEEKRKLDDASKNK